MCVMLTASALLYKCCFGHHVSARNATLLDRAQNKLGGDRYDRSVFNLSVTGMGEDN